MKRLLLLLPLIFLISCTSMPSDLLTGSTVIETDNTINEWKEMLTDEEFHVMWEKGTEYPGTGDLVDNKKKGTYVTAGCKIPVFHSSTKFDSGTGLPS